MSLVEIQHPLAQELTTISEAVSGGLEAHWCIPSNLKFKYISPLDDVDGCGMIYLADWETENTAIITIPELCTVDTGPAVFYGEDKKLTGARIVVKDFLGRSFRMNTSDGQEKAAPFSQFDVIEEGIVLSTELDGLSVIQVGLFEGEEYDVFYETARVQASIALLHEAAVEFLGL